MKAILSILAVLVSVSAFAGSQSHSLLVKNEINQHKVEMDDCLGQSSNSSTFGMKVCLGEYNSRVDDILNREYQLIMKSLGQTPSEIEEKSRFRQSQRDWINFRDSNCHWEASQMLGGTGEGVIEIGCLGRMTAERVEKFMEIYYFD